MRKIRGPLPPPPLPQAQILLSAYCHYTVDHHSRHRKINGRQSNDIELWWAGRTAGAYDSIYNPYILLFIVRSRSFRTCWVWAINIDAKRALRSTVDGQYHQLWLARTRAAMPPLLISVPWLTSFSTQNIFMIRIESAGGQIVIDSEIHYRMMKIIWVVIVHSDNDRSQRHYEYHLAFSHSAPSCHSLLTGQCSYRGLMTLTCSGQSASLIASVQSHVFSLARELFGFRL